MIFPAVMSRGFVSTFPVAMFPVSVFCLTASALIYGIIKMKLSFLVIVRRIHEIKEHRAHCINFGVLSKWFIQDERCLGKELPYLEMKASNKINTRYLKPRDAWGIVTSNKCHNLMRIYGWQKKLRVSRRMPGDNISICLFFWFETRSHNVAQAMWPQTLHLPASASHVLELQA